MSVRRSNSGFYLRSLLQNCFQVRHILFNVVLDGNKDSFACITENVVRFDIHFCNDIRHAFLGQGQFGFLIKLISRDGLIIYLHIGSCFHSLNQCFLAEILLGIILGSCHDRKAVTFFQREGNAGFTCGCNGSQAGCQHCCHTQSGHFFVCHNFFLLLYEISALCTDLSTFY